MRNPLEQYLEQIETRLGELPAEERQGEVQEIRQHIQDAAQARVEMGFSREEAVAQTLKQFGAAQQVGAELARAYKRNHAGLRGSLLSAAAYAYVFGLGINLLQRGLLPLLSSATAKSGGMVLLPHWWLASLIAIPVLLGGTTALLFPRKALPGIALSYGIACGFSMSRFHNSLPASLSSDMRVHLYVTSMMTALISLLIALLSAKGGVLWGKARQRRLRLT